MLCYVNKQQTHSKSVCLDRGQTQPGLVTFYDIRPGNGVGLFFQPWRPH